MAQTELSKLAWVYIGLAIGWTVALAVGLSFLYVHRHMPFLAIRRLPILFLGIISLHIYGVLCCIGYSIMSHIVCTAEFWLMSIYLPFGFAMFHAANSQFLHVASRQKQFTHLNSFTERKTTEIEEHHAERLASSRFQRVLRGVERADRIDRLMVYISIGLAVQLALTLFIFFASKKFHPSYGLFDYEVVGTQMQVRMECSKGWEWWITIVWQFFWAWIYAPYMLLKSRGVRDVHGWRIQTICCCLAGLPASPLWLAGLYLPQMSVVNQYLIPPFWFSISIFLMEVITVGFPIVQVFRTKALRKETLDAIASWEKRLQMSSSDSTMVEITSHSRKSDAYSGITFKTSADTPIKSSLESQKSDMLTMAALENALRTNSEPLLQFAALKDFSGENISFLSHVSDWKRGWFSTISPTMEHRHHQFVSAVRMYATFVSLEFSEFPINISSREMKRLHHIFATAANMLLRQHSISSTASATPFDQLPPDSSSSTTDLKSGINLSELGRANLQASTRVIGQDGALAGCEIPLDFTDDVFDTAENEIKYLVLTNTWPKFVNAGRPDSVLEKGISIGGDNEGAWRHKYFCLA